MPISNAVANVNGGANFLLTSNDTAQAILDWQPQAPVEGVQVAGDSRQILAEALRLGQKGLTWAEDAAPGGHFVNQAIAAGKAGQWGTAGLFAAGSIVDAGMAVFAPEVKGAGAVASSLENAASKVVEGLSERSVLVESETNALQRIAANNLVNSTERSARIAELSEENAGRYLAGFQTEVQASVPNAHFFDRHGFATAFEEQYIRASTGLTRDNVQQGILVNSSRFLTAADHVAVIQRAESIHMLTGNSVINLNVGVVIGEGFAKLKSNGSGLDYLMSTGVRAVFRNGVVFAKFPILKR
jgi:hypothetical protein